MAIAAKITPVVPTPEPYDPASARRVISGGVSVTSASGPSSPGGSAAARSGLPLTLPAPQQAARDLLRVQGEDQVVAPVAVDVQVAGPQPLLAEAQLADHPKALLVLRSDGDLDPVQVHHLEAVVDGQGDGRRDDPAA